MPTGSLSGICQRTSLCIFGCFACAGCWPDIPESGERVTSHLGSGKTLEVAGAVDELDADTVIFDDELTPGQLRNLERAWGDNIRLCDRTALILDIFSQRAATKEGQLQVCLIDTLCSFSFFHLNHTRVLFVHCFTLD